MLDGTAPVRPACPRKPTFWLRVCCCWASYFPSSWGYLVIIFSNDDQLTWNRHIYETIQSPFKWPNMTGFFLLQTVRLNQRSNPCSFDIHPKIPIGSHDALTKSTLTPCLKQRATQRKNVEAAKLLVSETTWSRGNYTGHGQEKSPRTKEQWKIREWWGLWVMRNECLNRSLFLA